MKKLFLVIALLTLAFFNGKTQTTWEKLFGAKSDDVFRCVHEVPAGGYIAAGYTSDSTVNDTDAFVVRLNTSGDTIWTFKYNGPLSKKDLFYKVINTSDGGFALCGYTNSFSGAADDALYLKLNSSGVLQWVKYYGGNSKERAQDIIQTSDNGYAIVGYTGSAPAQYYDAFLIRTNANGDTLWTKRYGASGYDDANSVKILSDGGFILGGQSENGTNLLDQYLVRTNSSGSLIWSKRFGAFGKNDNIESVALLSDGFILAGNTNTTISGDDGNLVKTDTGGTVIWSKSYGGLYPDDFHTVDTTSDGGFIASGTTSSSGSLDDGGLPAPNMWLMRTNSSGDSLWSKAFGGASHDHGYSAEETTDGGYIIVGHTGSFRNNAEGYVVKTDGSGDVANHLTYTTVYDIITPSSTTCGGPNTQIKIKLQNYSNYTVANIPCTLQITGALIQTINQTFSASSDTVTFSTTINTSAGGTYTFTCFTNNNNDVYPVRNSITKTFTINIAAAAPTVTSNSRCGNGTVPLAASAPASIYWFSVPSNGSSIFTGTAFTTPSLSSTTTYYVQTGIACPSARIPVIATINPISANPLTVGDSRCGSGTLTLTATAPDSITWYNAPSGGGIVGTGLSYTTPVLSTTTNYYAQARNGTCPSSRILAIANVGSPASDPVTTSDQHCGPGTVLLIANSFDPVFWYDSATGGALVDTGNSFTTPLLDSTKIYYAQANNGCLSNRIAATAMIKTLAADPIPTSDHRCGIGTLTLGATAVDPVIWFDADSAGNQVGFGSTFTTPILTTTKIYYVQANNGTCPSNRIAVDATIFTLPTISLGSDTVVNGITYPLDAGSGFNTYLWSTTETSQTIAVSSTGTFCVTVTDSNSCSNNDCVFIDLINGIHGITQNKLFSVYPNPSNGIITISNPIMPYDIKIDLMNITGDIINGIYTYNSDRINLDLTSLTKGVYLLKIKTELFSEIEKLIIQ